METKTEAQMNIMLVEDDEILSREIMIFLRRWGYRVSTVKAFDRIAAEFGACRPHLVLLDVNLPYYDGFYWCAKIREISNVPIIFISSRDDDADKIMAMAQGGDDYVEKPFPLEVMRAKIEAVIRRTYQYKVKERVYLQGDIYFEQENSSLLMREQEIDLTKSERRIMAKLIENRPDIVTRDDLMTALWNTDEFVSDGTLTTLVSRLRNKLSSVCGDEFIRTKKGIGYYIE